MRCLYCGKRLALLSKLTNGEFCSAAHRKRYQEDQDRLALARLIAEPQRVARSGTQIPGLAGFVASPPQRVSGSPGVGFHRLPVAPAAADLQLSVVVIEEWPRTTHPPLCLPCALELALAPAAGMGEAAEEALALVGWERDVAGLGVAVGLTGGEMPLSARLDLPLSPREEQSTSCEPILMAALNNQLAIGLHAPQASPCAAFGAVLEHHPQPSAGRPLALDTDAQPAGADAPVRWSASTRGLLRTTGFPDALTRLPEQMPWGGLALPEAIQDLRLPGMPAGATPFDTPLAGPRSGFSPVELRTAGTAASASQPAAGELGRRGPALVQHLFAPTAALPLAVAPRAAGALPLADSQTLSPRVAQGDWDVRSEVVEEPVGVRAPAPPPNGLVPTAVLANLAAQVESDVRSADSPAAAAGPQWLVQAGQTPVVPALPAAEDRTASLAAWHEQSIEACAPPALEAVPDLTPHSPGPAAPCECEELSGVEVKLAPRLATGVQISPRNWSWLRAQLAFEIAAAKPARPRARLETVAPGCEQPVAAPLLAGQPSHWGSAKRFWNTAPADLKWLTLALPVILAVALFSSTPTGRSEKFTAGRGSSRIGALRAVQEVVQARWENLRENIVSRAAISLQDDFRSGLSAWQGRGDWAKGWSYDPAGFVRSGPLALYRPSLRLADYQLEFLGQIERKSIGWVFRAVDLDNYYATKIVVLKPGPLPTVGIVRYAVIDGREQDRVQMPLPITVRNDMLYRVRVEVRGQNFTTSVQGQVIDFWSDDRLTRGGVGFFSAKGEQARLRWIEVSHQYDALGRLCAYLAPYSIQSASGSLNQ